MSKLTPDTIKRAVDFIEMHKDNPDFKTELAKRNLKLFPNSLKFLIDQLTKLGYQITPPQKSSNKEDTNKSEKVEVQISLDRKMEEENVDNNNRSYWETDEKEGIPNDQEDGAGFQETTLQGMWTKVLKTIRQNSVMVYSLVVNAKLLDYKDNTVTIGFLPQHSYQLKQLQREQNLKHITEVLKSVFSANVALKCIILKD